MEGDCYELVTKYLETRNTAYIVTDDIRGRTCRWNFKGNTDADFKRWCEVVGLHCGGNPFVVAFDSVYYAGQRVPKAQADFLREQERKLNEADQQRKRDSVSAIAVPLPLRHVTIEYLEIGSSTADKLGFLYSDFIGGAEFWKYNDLFSVSAQAKNMGDSTHVYRTYTSVYDSTLNVFWGGKRDRLTQSNVTSTGVVSNNYTTETYGLRFALDGSKYSYEHSTDYEHSISGTGKLHDGYNHIFGVYQYDYEQVNYVPFLGEIPILRHLFRHVQNVTETRYVFISVFVMDYLEELKDET